MYERLNRSTENALAFRITESLSRDEVRALAEELKKAIEAAGKIRVLLELKAFPYGDLGALWEDFKFEIRHAPDIEYLALVGDEDVEKYSHRLFGELIATNIHYFVHDEVDEAWAWLTGE